mgnify:CR=1 FL=1
MLLEAATVMPLSSVPGATLHIISIVDLGMMNMCLIGSRRLSFVVCVLSFIVEDRRSSSLTALCKTCL